MNSKSSKGSYPITPLLGIYTEKTIRGAPKNVFTYEETHCSTVYKVYNQELKVKLVKLWNIRNMDVVG